MSLLAGGRQAAAKVAQEINEGIVRREFKIPRPEDRVTFDRYSKLWLQGHVAKNLKWNTRRYYADMVERIPASLKSRTLDEITREDVRKLAFGVLEKQLARSTAAGLLRTISALDDAVPAGESGGHANTTRMEAETRTGNGVPEVGQAAEMAG